MQGVEHCQGMIQAIFILCVPQADAFDQERDAVGLRAAKLAVLQIQVMNDFGNDPQGPGIEFEALEQSTLR